nr:MAG TPA_asm: hypothetical protein [Caudoviricetes sp.]DAV04463.1 MAG TPA: hypothetical protein [Caudoviricetes sp.]
MDKLFCPVVDKNPFFLIYKSNSYLVKSLI